MRFALLISMVFFGCGGDILDVFKSNEPQPKGVEAISVYAFTPVDQPNNIGLSFYATYSGNNVNLDFNRQVVFDIEIFGPSSTSALVVFKEKPCTFVEGYCDVSPLLEELDIGTYRAWVVDSTGQFRMDLEFAHVDVKP